MSIPNKHLEPAKPNLLDDLFYYGDLLIYTVDEAVSFGDVGHFDGTSGRYKKSDKVTEAEMPVTVMFLESKVAGESCLMLERGWVRNDAWSWTAGDRLWIGNDVLSNVTPISTEFAQIAGYALASNIVRFDPSKDYFEVP